MADLRFQDRLRPALLDRLEQDPAASKKGSASEVMSMRQLREAVLRDLAWLLNATSLDSAVDLESYPHVARSVLNYGMPDMTGCIGLDRAELARRLRRVILDFEPRLTRSSVKVRAETDDEGSHPGNTLRFHIEAELWAEPVPIQLFLKTQVDFETGDVDVVETTGEE